MTALLDMETFMQSLVIMGEGMGEIMFVIILITLIVLLISKIDAVIEDKKTKKEE